ncbi:MAG TPA: hypothetical protein VFW65_19625 [Pseudonocardiaceae bacterium]|nr:hypothetical protein [Pseudonocardiaceae bacterium]
MENVSRRILVVATAATLIGLTATACRTEGQAAPSRTVTSAPTVPSRTTTSAPTTTIRVAPGTTTRVAPATTAKPSAATTQTLKFPNTSADVVFVGYDLKDKLVEFQKVVDDRTSSLTANLVPDPSDPAVHRLPLKPGIKIVSIDPGGFQFETCPPTSCTVDQVMQSVISHNYGQFWAHIHVNAADQIDVVRQSAY